MRAAHLTRITATASLTRAICSALALLIQRGWREMSMPLRAIALLMRAIGAYTVSLLSHIHLTGPPAGSCKLQDGPCMCAGHRSRRDGYRRGRGGFEPPGAPKRVRPERRAIKKAASRRLLGSTMWGDSYRVGTPVLRGAWLLETAVAGPSPNGCGDASKRLAPAVKVLVIICVSFLLGT